MDSKSAIKEWFKNGCEYKAGIQLYSQIPHNKRLLKIFQSKNTPFTCQKLSYELTNFLNASNSFSTGVTDSLNNAKPNKVDIKTNISIKKPISFYPVELHNVYKKRISSYYDACTLKIQLNELQEELYEEALDLQLKIFKTWEINDKCFKILEHYENYKRVLPFETQKQYENLSPMSLVNERQRLYSRVTKRKKTLLNLESKYSVMPEGPLKNNLLTKINNKREELQELTLQIEKLSNTIETNEH